MRIGIISIGMIVLLIASTIPAVSALNVVPRVSFDEDNLQVKFKYFENYLNYLIEVKKLPGNKEVESIPGEINNNNDVAKVTTEDISSYLTTPGLYQITAYVDIDNDEKFEETEEENEKYLDTNILITRFD
jgi:hypothetical protein